MKAEVISRKPASNQVPVAMIGDCDNRNCLARRVYALANQTEGFTRREWWKLFWLIPLFKIEVWYCYCPQCNSPLRLRIFTYAQG